MQYPESEARSPMNRKLALVSLALVASSVSACATAASEGDPYPDAPGDWAMYGQVEAIQQSGEYVHGDPGGGAVAGAVIGGLLGTALGGRGFGTFVGAAEGAAIGAQSSAGGYVVPAFHVHVRFDDGSLRTFVYRNQLPFRRGDRVVWTAQGLARYDGY
jgi:outer membrane lipoprotein SlyB